MLHSLAKDADCFIFIAIASQSMESRIRSVFITQRALAYATGLIGSDAKEGKKREGDLHLRSTLRTRSLRCTGTCACMRVDGAAFQHVVHDRAVCASTVEKRNR